MEFIQNDRWVLPDSESPLIVRKRRDKTGHCILQCSLFADNISTSIISLRLPPGSVCRWTIDLGGLCLLSTVLVKTMMALGGTGISDIYPDSKVHGANMGPPRGRQDPVWPHAILVCIQQTRSMILKCQIDTCFFTKTSELVIKYELLVIGRYHSERTIANCWNA